MSSRLRFPKAASRSSTKRGARAWMLAGLGILAAGTSCGPIAKSAFKTNRFAAPTEREEAPSTPNEQGLTGSGQSSGLTPVLEVRKPLAITYITRVVDAAALESVRTLWSESADLTEALFATPSSSAPSPSPAPSTTGGASAADANRVLTSWVISETKTLDEDQLDTLQARGIVEIALPELPVGMSPSKVTGIFHVIQNDEFELLEEDEGFRTELDLFKAESGYHGTLRTRLDPVQDLKTASTLSRTVRVDLEIEATLLGPVTAGSKAETASVPGTTSTR